MSEAQWILIAFFSAIVLAWFANRKGSLSLHKKHSDSAEPFEAEAIRRDATEVRGASAKMKKKRGSKELISSDQRRPQMESSEESVVTGMVGWAVESKGQLSCFGLTDKGKKRDLNEDAILTMAHVHVFAVADGMGGHNAGEVASTMALGTLFDAFQTQTYGGKQHDALPKSADELVRAIEEANRKIHQRAQVRGDSSKGESMSGMGCTILSVRFSFADEMAYIAHVGDSRAYRFRKGSLLQLTTDHTLASRGVEGHDAHKLSRALGVLPDVMVEVTTDSIQEGDVYMLCTDGLSRMVPTKKLSKILEETFDLEKASKFLIAEANRAGGHDNISVILVRIGAV